MYIVPALYRYVIMGADYDVFMMLLSHARSDAVCGIVRIEPRATGGLGDEVFLKPKPFANRHVNFKISASKIVAGGVIVGCRTCHREVLGSTSGRVTLSSGY